MRNRFARFVSLFVLLLLVALARPATAARPYLVRDINQLQAGSNPKGFVEMQGVAYFSAQRAAEGRELWRTDGTDAGTFRVRDICPGPCSSDPAELAVFAGRLYFKAQDGIHGAELWSSDGTAAGTAMVVDAEPGPNPSSPQFLTPMGGSLYFRASTLAAGLELWRSDGTAAGTAMVRDIVPGAGGGLSFTDRLTASGGRLFFSAIDASAGQELWSSDGTSAGTALVADIVPGAGDSYPQELVDLGAGSIVFRGGVHGRELWRSDGTAAGTYLVGDIAPGSASSLPDSLNTARQTGAGRPSWLEPVGTRLFLWADDGTHGYEPWAVETGTLDLLRDASLTSIDPPQPPIATLLPLSSPGNLYRIGVAAGFTLPEQAGPLVFFSLDSPAPLYLTRTPAGEIRFDF